jgi:hypothetical protein
MARRDDMQPRIEVRPLHILQSELLLASIHPLAHLSGNNPAAAFLCPIAFM